MNYEDDRLRHAILTGSYDAIVIQEQGGKVLCGRSVEERTSPGGCRDSVIAHTELAKMASSTGARIYYLGTYQPDPTASRDMVDIERQLSKEMTARFIEISETWRRAAARIRICSGSTRTTCTPGLR